MATVTACRPLPGTGAYLPEVWQSVHHGLLAPFQELVGTLWQVLVQSYNFV